MKINSKSETDKLSRVYTVLIKTRGADSQTTTGTNSSVYLTGAKWNFFKIAKIARSVFQILLIIISIYQCTPTVKIEARTIQLLLKLKFFKLIKC